MAEIDMQEPRITAVLIALRPEPYTFDFWLLADIIMMARGRRSTQHGCWCNLVVEAIAVGPGSDWP